MTPSRADQTTASPRSAFAFVGALCDAIVAFSADGVREDPGAFYYRGADLQYAAERALYFRFVDSEHLYSYFTSAARGDARLLQREMESLLRAVRANAHTPSPFERLRLARRRARARYQRLRDSLSRTPADSLSAGITAANEANRPVVLAHVIHPKFVRYLRPVLARLDAPHAYLISLDPAVKHFLDSEGLSYVDAPHVERAELPTRRGTLDDFAALMDWYDRFHAVLSRVKPRCVVLAEGNAPQDEVINRVCGRLGIPTVCVQQGWSPVIHSGFRNMSYTRMTVWGKGFAEALQPYNPHQQFVVTGHHQLSVTTTADSAGDSKQDPGVGFFLQGRARLITHDAWATFLHLVEQTAEEFPRRQLFVREHPNAPLTDSERGAVGRFANVQLVPPSMDALSDVLPRICLAVSIFSTVILESIAAGVLPLVVNLTSMPSYNPDVAGAGAGIEVRDAAQAMDAIRRVLIDPDYLASFAPGLDAFRRRHFDSASGAAGRIAGHIATCAESGREC